MNDEDFEASMLADEVLGHAARPAAEGITEMTERIERLRAQILEASGRDYFPAQIRLIQRLQNELHAAEGRLVDYQLQLASLN